MSLRGHPVSQSATLPDGREVTIDVRLFDDEYVEARSSTVMVELTSAGEVLASVNTVLEPEQRSEALELARRIAAGLESGELEPTAGALEPLADELP